MTLFSPSWIEIYLLISDNNLWLATVGVSLLKIDLKWVLNLCQMSVQSEAKILFFTPSNYLVQVVVELAIVTEPIVLLYLQTDQISLIS